MRDRPLDYRSACVRDQEAACTAVNKHVHEVFVVVKTNTIGDPVTVVIHLEDTMVTL